jgi:large subunit ribosomal protein L18
MKKRIIVQYRRKTEGRTDYYRRLSLLKSGKPRLVIRKTLKNIIIQLVEYVPNGDKIIVAYNTKSLTKLGWKHSNKNISAAYLGGLMIGKLALGKKTNEAILDLGLQPSIKGSKIYAVIKGAIDAGLNVPCDKKMFPNEERTAGKHIVDYHTKLKKQNVENLSKDFISIKEKIIKGN